MVVFGCGHVVVLRSPYVKEVRLVVVVGGRVVFHVVVVVCQVVVVDQSFVDVSGQVVVFGCDGHVVVLGGQFLFILFNFLLYSPGPSSLSSSVSIK